MSERSPLTSAMKNRRDPTARHSMYVLRQDGPELSFTDAVKNQDALLTSIYGSRSVDQHLTTATTTKADVSALGNAGRPRSTVTFPPVAKSTTSSVWQPLFHHTTLVGSAAPLLATFKRDTHVQTEDEIRSDVGVQTEEAEIQPTATYKRDVLVQTGEVWAGLVSGGGEESTTRHSEITTNSTGDACTTVFFYPEAGTAVKQIDEEDPVSQKQTSEALFRDVVVKGALQSPTVQVINRNFEDFNEKNINSLNLAPKSEHEIVRNSSYIFITDNRPQIYSALSEKDYVSCVPICKSEVSFVPHRPECVAEGGFTVVSDGFENVYFPPLESDELQECPSTKFFTTYEVITLKGSQEPDSRPVECENSPKLPVPSSHQNKVSAAVPRTLTPVKTNRNSLNMDDYKCGRLSSCNTSERGSVVSVLDALYADSFKFESCENLDQLEEEIIRSLCTPVEELEENSRPVEENTVDLNSPEQVGRVPNSQRYFNNMSDQQKTEWHPDGKVTPRQMNCDLQSNDVMRSPNNFVRVGTPTKIDKRGMEARGEIIEKVMKGETVDSHILNNFDLNSDEKVPSPQPAEGNEITVELLPAQLIASTPVLEVRRSSWSATNDPEHTQKANGNTSKIQYDRTGCSSRDSPAKDNLDKNESEVAYLHNSLAAYNKQGQDNTGNFSPKAEIVSEENPTAVKRPTYWPLLTSNESEPVAKSEVHVNLTPSNGPSTYCDSLISAETNTTKKPKSAPPTPPLVVPPPPPPPPPQCYQPSKISEIPVDNNAKVHDTSSCLPHSKNSSPGFFTSSPKDLMMQELAERFQKRQRDATNSREGINLEGNYLPSYYNKENSNVSTSLHPHAQKESSPGSNPANPSFKSVWSSMNGENYIDHNGKDSTYSSADKNGIQHNCHSPQEAIPGQDVKQHQMGNHTSNFTYGGQYDEPHGYPNKDDTKYPSSYSGTTILTDEPPPAGAILVDQKVSVEGDQVHTDKYYAVPLKEVLKEKTSTAKFTPAPPKYEGIGPTEDGVPTGLRQSVKKENMSNWYKTMFKSLHKAGHPHYGGYNSDPEFEREEKAIITKCATLDTRQKPSDSSRQPTGRLQHGYPPSAKSSVEVYYNIHPRPIEDYEPGYSSVVDNENTTGSKRFLPSLNYPKPAYEFKSGYESDTSIIKKLHQPEGPHPEQQKIWYREIQRGGDIPQYGLGKLAPEKPKVPVIGPAPTPSIHSSPVKPTYPQAVRPHTPPPESVINDSSVTEVSNDNYSAHMQHAIHAELQRRMSPGTQQSSVVYRASPKSPSKSPELKMFARVLYDFVSESPRELNLKKDELILVLRQLDKNWYEGEHKGAIGIFPVSYVEILPPEHVSPQMKQPLEGLAKAVYDFRAQTSVELPLKKGDTVTLLRRVDQNWYEGRIHDKKGIFPATYVQVVQEPGEPRSSLSPTSRATDSPHSLKAQEDSVKKSPVVCPAPPPTTYSSSRTGTTISNSPSAARGKKGSNFVEPVLYRALYGYNPQNADELELSEGDNVYVVEMCDDGWFVGTSVRTGVFGIFPGNYVEKIGMN